VSDDRYGIDELADLAGVTRRTVRYYVQEGLLPAPLGVGRGRHYGPAHREALLRIKALQERRLSLDDVRRALRGPRREAAEPRRVSDAARAAVPETGRPSPRSAWTRVELLPGVEMHVSSRLRLPSPRRIEELAEWCRTHFVPESD
jgi:DNA-binding transcriptional MerR regulator